MSQISKSASIPDASLDKKVQLSIYFVGTFTAFLRPYAEENWNKRPPYFRGMSLSTLI